MSLWLREDIDFTQEVKKEGRFGGEGHTKECQEEGPVLPDRVSGGIFNESKRVDRCSNCHREIRGAK